MPSLEVALDLTGRRLQIAWWVLPAWCWVSLELGIEEAGLEATGPPEPTGWGKAEQGEGQPTRLSGTSWTQAALSGLSSHSSLQNKGPLSVLLLPLPHTPRQSPQGSHLAPSTHIHARHIHGPAKEGSAAQPEGAQGRVQERGTGRCPELAWASNLSLQVPTYSVLWAMPDSPS